MPLTKVNGQMLDGAITADSSGNVGIGTTSVTSGWRFEVKGGLPAIFNADSTANTATYGGVAFYRPTNTASNGNGIQFALNNSSSTQVEYAYIGGLIETNTAGSQNGAIIFAPTSANSRTERMRITSGGEVCVNATSAYGSARFYVNAPQPTSANWWVSTLRTAATNVATTMIAFIDGSNDFCGQVYIDPTSNTTVFSTSSDYRLKDNVAPMTGALAKVQALNPVTYTWKKSGKTGQGFIAHELQEIVPECVVGEKDAMRTYTDEEGNEQTAILPQMVDTSFLVATLTAAIQELKAELDATKAEVAELKARGQ